ncbi:MAG: hypothetical protein WA317_15730, partial [Mycobacterium sp.]
AQMAIGTRYPSFEDGGGGPGALAGDDADDHDLVVYPPPEAPNEWRCYFTEFVCLRVYYSRPISRFLLPNAPMFSLVHETPVKTVRFAAHAGR